MKAHHVARVEMLTFEKQSGCTKGDEHRSSHERKEEEVDPSVLGCGFCCSRTENDPLTSTDQPPHPLTSTDLWDMKAFSRDHFLPKKNRSGEFIERAPCSSFRIPSVSKSVDPFKEMLTNKRNSRKRPCQAFI